MKFIKLVKASEEWKVLRRHHDTEDGEEYYYIEGPNGIYQDEDGNTYKFDTKEDALEELDYLRAEHKFDKKSAETDFKFKLTEDFYKSLESILEKIEYKASFKNGTLQKDEIISCLEEATLHFEEFLDEIK